MKKGDGRSKAARLVKLVAKDEAKKVIYDWSKLPPILTPDSPLYDTHIKAGVKLPWLGDEYGSVKLVKRRRRNEILQSKARG